MPEQATLRRAEKDKREGKAPTTQFIREEFEHIREGKHGARSAKQAISRQAHRAARQRTAADRSASARKAARTRAGYAK